MTDETNQLPAEVKLTPIMRMMEVAVERGNIEVVAKLMDLQERAEAAQARREFDAAFAAVKAKIGIVRKTGMGHNNKPYADMADIARALDHVIAEHGLSYRFRSQRVGNELLMTCVVCHRSGHYEENSLPSPLDTSGSKNPVQAVGSTSTYLQRYCLTQAFGLAASVNGGDIHDDDGAGADVHQPGDYVGNGTRAKDTEPKGPATYSRRDIAEITKVTSVTALHDWGAAHSRQVNGYPPDIRDKVYKAFRARLTELEDREMREQSTKQLEQFVGQVVHEEDGERPARPEDFAEDTVEQIAPISQRAIKAREYTRPPNLQEVGPFDFPELPAELDRRNER